MSSKTSTGLLCIAPLVILILVGLGYLVYLNPWYGAIVISILISAFLALVGLAILNND